MVEAGGVGTFRPIENTQVIENARRSKLEKRTKCGQLERIWNAGFLLKFARIAALRSPMFIQLVFVWKNNLRLIHSRCTKSSRLHRCRRRISQWCVVLAEVPLLCSS